MGYAERKNPNSLYNLRRKPAEAVAVVKLTLWQKFVAWVKSLFNPIIWGKAGKGIAK